jgi:hypothetical protein
MARVDVAYEAEFSGVDGGWTDISADVLERPYPTAEYGITEVHPLAKVADIGALDLYLNNSIANSGATAGYYSPDHASVRSGFAPGIRLRMGLTQIQELVDHTARNITDHSGNYIILRPIPTQYKFAGELARAKPDAGAKGPRRTACEIEDWMGFATRTRTERIAIQTDQRMDEVITTMLANVNRQPFATSLATSKSTLPYSLDTTRDERTSIAAELNKLALSEFAPIYPKGDDSTGNVLTAEQRYSRAVIASSATLNDTMVELEIDHGLDLVFNRIRATVHPRKVDDAATTVLFSLAGTPDVGAGETITIVGRYRDPAQEAIRVGGTAMVTPVENTDYEMNTAADGSGTDLSSSFSVTATYGGNSVEYVITNNHASSTGYITLLQARGKGVYDLSPITIEVEDSTSIAAYGDRLLEFDMPYQTSITVAKSCANHTLGVWKDPQGVPRRCSFYGNASDSLMTAGLTVEPGSKVTITETQTGINTVFAVAGLKIIHMPSKILKFEWILIPASAEAYWICEDATAGVLGTTTNPGW